MLLNWRQLSPRYFQKPLAFSSPVVARTDFVPAASHSVRKYEPHHNRSDTQLLYREQNLQLGLE